MKNIEISDGVLLYAGTVPDNYVHLPNFPRLRQAFADGYCTLDAAHSYPIDCTVFNENQQDIGSFVLHANGDGGTIESDDPRIEFDPIEWVG
ncbi:MAG TPA: hypothetical protein ENH62_10595 [Marinobacter sp.]|uniref:Uncharacterized protein n=1 Tax=marine sediment metagenome TaxID=412755 RepID=A0A0F9JQQ4_9ZZZZ|nr:hypothetical protein [Marinobacter sp.]